MNENYNSMDNMDFKPAYVQKDFNSKKDFDRWLEKFTFQTIKFMDKGQNLQKMWIDEHGEILHCDFQANIYNRRFIDLEGLSIMSPITISEKGFWATKADLMVIEINLV